MDTSSAGYRCSQFPEPESYNLNRLLYALRMNADERQRFVQNMDGMFTEYQLRIEEMAAVKTPRSPEGRQSRRTSNPGLDCRSPRGGRHARAQRAENGSEQNPSLILRRRFAGKLCAFKRKTAGSFPWRVS